MLFLYINEADEIKIIARKTITMRARNADTENTLRDEAISAL